MGYIAGKQKYRDALLGLGLFLSAFALVLWPQPVMDAMRDGLKLCGNVIIPSLFPFFVLSSLVVELGMSRYLGRLLEPLMMPLFRVNAKRPVLPDGGRTPAGFLQQLRPRVYPGGGGSWCIWERSRGSSALFDSSVGLSFDRSSVPVL